MQNNIFPEQTSLYGNSVNEVSIVPQVQTTRKCFAIEIYQQKINIKE